MDFPFNINNVLPEEITKVDKRFQVCRQNGIDRYGFQELQRMLYEVIDKMGDASAKAQKLPGTITTGKRLENSNHNLYLMKDTSGEKSCVVGILKVGTKKLFVYDSCKNQHELEPMCVLDFYVHESRQRMGCGKKLFDFMLRNENIPAQHLAVDRPSPKFLSFLKKHYRLHATIDQVNNFVIFDGFFNHRTDLRNGHRRLNGSGYQSNTSNRMVQNSGRKTRTPMTPQQFQQQDDGNYSSFPSSKYQSRQSTSYMGAGARMYNRHGATPPSARVTPPNNTLTTPPLPVNGVLTGSNASSPLAPRSDSSFNKYSVLPNNGTLRNENPQNQTHDVNFNKMTSPHMQYAMGTNMARYQQNIMSAPDAGGPQGHSNRFQPSSAQNIKSCSKDPQHLSSNNGAFINGGGNNPIFLPEIANGSSARQSDNNNHRNNNISQRPPSGKRTNQPEPPILQRDGPPAEYQAMLNLHQTYQGRNGRFVTPSEAKPTGTATNYANSLAKPPYRTSTYDQSFGNNADWNWSVSGYVREQRMKQNVSSQYNPGRLW